MTTQVGFCEECGIVRQDTDGVPDAECACMAKKSGHTDKCRYYISVKCWIAIPCEDHDADVCPTCDACDCGAGSHRYFKKDGKTFSVKE
jgi:hypothetical protein